MTRASGAVTRAERRVLAAACRWARSLDDPRVKSLADLCEQLDQAVKTLQHARAAARRRK